MDPLKSIGVMISRKYGIADFRKDHSKHWNDVQERTPTSSSATKPTPRPTKDTQSTSATLVTEVQNVFLVLSSYAEKHKKQIYAIMELEKQKLGSFPAFKKKFLRHFIQNHFRKQQQCEKTYCEAKDVKLKQKIYVQNVWTVNFDLLAGYTVLHSWR